MSRKRVENRKEMQIQVHAHPNSNQAAPKVKELCVIHQEKGIRAVVSLLSCKQYECRFIRPYPHNSSHLMSRVRLWTRQTRVLHDHGHSRDISRFPCRSR